MKLYYSKGACSLVVRIVINEIGVDSEYEAVDLKVKKTENNEDYYQINPKGAVPALEVSKGVVLTENFIIQQYLVDTYKATALCPAVGDLQRYKVLAWSNYVSTEIHKSFSNLFNPMVPQELKESLFIPIIKTKLTKLNKQLGEHRYLSGDHFAMPDAYLFVMLLWAGRMNVDISDLPQLSAYFAELKNRPSIKKSLKEEGIELN
ncbi:Glutathione S-transferase GST-6.0 [Legionella massiliensis]|uniref:Glutathione S-transferase GST-6.0 n=1 Tax=Legionella massiliensis TaxID=1034943 RepID=A0A078KZF5_9GAMM|nr:glutathione transferase GstA [Legionella massiliensis]CDZ77128.1 Glutathione S-transferase GST-6.0 [Legionella massiliensis]CEE12866.1 Glutathione S-transferase GST-6.0 [Legionella massiliensis]